MKDKFNININTLYEYKKPLCETEEQWGYLKFNEYDDQIKIGNKNSRHFKLLDELLNHFDIQKNIESVFEYIKLPKDKQNANLNDQYLQKNEMIKIIKNAIKELQRDKKISGKIKIEFSGDDTYIRATHY